MADPQTPQATPPHEDVKFTTTREELFQNLVAFVPSHFIVTESELGPGRRYYVFTGDLLDALKKFCDEKEHLARG